MTPEEKREHNRLMKRAWREKNPDKMKAYRESAVNKVTQERFKANNPDYYKNYYAAWYQRNRIEILAQKKAKREQMKGQNNLLNSKNEEGGIERHQ